MTDEEEVSDEFMDDMMLVIANFEPDELTRFAKLTGKTVEHWTETIVNWKAERVQ